MTGTRRDSGPQTGMIVARAAGHMWYRKASWRLRLRALWYLLRYFPDTVPVIAWFAIRNRANPGDIAVLTGGADSHRNRATCHTKVSRQWPLEETPGAKAG